MNGRSFGNGRNDSESDSDGVRDGDSECEDDQYNGLLATDFTAADNGFSAPPPNGTSSSLSFAPGRVRPR